MSVATMWQQWLQTQVKAQVNDPTPVLSEKNSAGSLFVPSNRTQVLKTGLVLCLPIIILLVLSILLLHEVDSRKAVLNQSRNCAVGLLQMTQSLHRLQIEEDVVAIYIATNHTTWLELYKLAINCTEKLTWNVIDCVEYNVNIANTIIHSNMDIRERTESIRNIIFYNNATIDRWSIIKLYRKIISDLTKTIISASSFRTLTRYTDYLKHLHSNLSFTKNIKLKNVTSLHTKTKALSNCIDLTETGRYWRFHTTSVNNSDQINQRNDLNTPFLYRTWSSFINVKNTERELTTEITTSILLLCLDVIVAIIVVWMSATYIINYVRMILGRTNDIRTHYYMAQIKFDELENGKKMSDQLLLQMLPRMIVQNLKLGKPIEPEQFEEVTIYFSDITGFGDVASTCSPILVVDLLNTLYGSFDECIGKYDVYKVETIGDSYLVASGLPTRNGHRHAAEVAAMALDMMSLAAELSLPDSVEPVPLRIGINTGPIVAAVIGLKNPRYCLFGDTINTASRMETSGEAYKLHTSQAFATACMRTGGFEFELRGVLNIKGKGNMTTYWLVGREATSHPIIVPTHQEVIEFNGIQNNLHQ